MLRDPFLLCSRAKGPFERVRLHKPNLPSGEGRVCAGNQGKNGKNIPEIVVAMIVSAPIVPPVKWNSNWFRRAGLVALLAFGAGCSGIHASKSISPATFLLPGLLKYEAPAAQDSFPAPPGELLAQN